MGFVQGILRIRQFYDNCPTFCKKCEQRTTRKFMDDGSYSERCACVSILYKYHLPDEHHLTGYFIKSEIPMKKFKQNHQALPVLEKLGMVKQANGKYVVA